MDERTLRLLEYHKIIEELTTFCTFSLGKEMVKNLRPKTQEREIKVLLQEVTEAVSILKEEGEPPFGGLRDIRSSLKRALQGSILSGELLLHILSTITGSKNLASFFSSLSGEYPLLSELLSDLKPPLTLAFEISEKIDDYGDLKDDASPTLRSIRGKIKALENRVQSYLEGMLSNSRYSTFLQDHIITLRNNRYVIPVKGQYRKNVPGLVHDRSASGQTLFIEPTAVVEMNNQIVEEVQKEEEEIYRLLKDLSQKVAFEAHALIEDLKIVTLLDFIFAKARYSKKIGGIEPLTGSTIAIKGGYHPLLKGTVVPIHIHLGEHFKTVVITGPNTGGKTVTLKTVGLFALMFQSGLHLPAQEGTSLPIFKQIFSDIGDEQSIEQSLSTFSSHMNQIVRIIDQVREGALVLLDELGAGTDPREGAALGISLLEFFIQKNVFTIATTHYSELKTFAYSNPLVENAAVEFDVETLSPTFRLIMGLPGKSNAFEISKRLGLDSSIIHRARERLTHDELKVETIIESLKKTGKELEEREYLLHLQQVQLEREREEYVKRLEDLEIKEREILKEAHLEAKELLRDTKEKMKRLIKKIKDEQGRVGDRLEGEINKELKESSLKIEEGLFTFQKREGHSVLTRVESGDTVYISTLKSQGRVLEVLEDQEGVVVQAGRIRVVASPQDLFPVQSSQEPVSSGGFSRIKGSKREEIRTCLDLRGLRADEALSKTDKYLDDAYLAGLKEVKIIHGKGKGALREVILELLQGHYHIHSFQTASPGDGGSGATLARLKD